MSSKYLRYGLEAHPVTWEHDSLRSQIYGDRFYSADGGLEESRYVFLNANGLPEAWRGRSRFVIGELGFGTGLNFLLTLRLWRESAEPGSRLFYLSCENHPLDEKEFERALRSWPDLEREREELLEKLPPPIIGTHVLSFSGGVTLHLLYNDAAEALSQATGPVDAWFLDGFAPAQNPQMWSPTVFKSISRLSHIGTSAATYSVAATVRSELESVGFAIEKRPGFGRKREMLTAVCHRGNEREMRPAPRTAVVIGGGLAGASVADSLTKRGFGVILVEQDCSPPERSSGNLAGVVMPHISARPDLMSRFYLAGYEHSLRTLKGLSEVPNAASGVIRLITSERLRKVYESATEMGFPESLMRVLTAEQVSELAGTPLAAPALYFPTGAWVSPKGLCRSLLENSAIERKLGIRIESIERSDSGWTVRDSQGQSVASAETVVFCGAYESLDFSQTRWLPVERVRGQAMVVDATAASRQLKQVLCYDGYLCPPIEGKQLIGATYDHENYSMEPDEEQNRDLFERLHRWAPKLDLRYSGNEQTRVNFRTMSRDRLPLCGPLADPTAFEKDRQLVAQKRWEEAGLLRNFYVSIGHGSRGLVSCLLCGELLAAQIAGEPLPIERDLMLAVHPSRFLARLVAQGCELNEEALKNLKVPHLR